MRNKVLIFGLIIILVLYLSLIIISRNPLILDDLNPATTCIPLKKSDIIYVIPLYKNDSLLNYPEWCTEMKARGKIFGLHGITHDYHEFLSPVDERKLEEAINIFEKCLGYRPKLFRPPYNKISPENEELIESLNMVVYKRTYILHPYCHCTPKLLMRVLNRLIGC